MHRIRLPKPWNVTSSWVTDPNRADVRITTHEFRRTFQSPTGLSPNTCVAIEIALDNDPNELLGTLNDVRLAIERDGVGCYRAKVDLAHLQTMNRLCLTITRRDEPMVADEPQQEPLPHVALSIS